MVIELAEGLCWWLNNIPLSNGDSNKISSAKIVIGKQSPDIN